MTHRTYHTGSGDYRFVLSEDGLSVAVYKDGKAEHLLWLWGHHWHDHKATTRLRRSNPEAGTFDYEVRAYMEKCEG